MNQKSFPKLRAFRRLTIPLLIGLMLALPLTACGQDGALHASVHAAG